AVPVAKLRLGALKDGFGKRSRTGTEVKSAFAHCCSLSLLLDIETRIRAAGAFADRPPTACPASLHMETPMPISLRRRWARHPAARRHHRRATRPRPARC